MPLSDEKKREYQRELMRKRRGKTRAEEIESGEFDDVVDDINTRATLQNWPGTFKPYRAPNGNYVLEPPTEPYDKFHVHHFTRKLGEETATCHLCGEIVRYENRPLNIYNDDLPDWPQLIRESPNADRIQKKMPVSQKRDQR